jgi:hypothetical protein
MDGDFDHSGSNIAFFTGTPVPRAGATDDIKDALTAYGLLQGTSATPLNLDAGALLCGSVTASAPGTGLVQAETFGVAGAGVTGVVSAWSPSVDNAQVLGDVTKRWISLDLHEAGCRIKDQSANFHGALRFNSASTALNADRNFTVDLDNASRILAMTGNATLNQDVTTTSTPTFSDTTVDDIDIQNQHISSWQQVTISGTQANYALPDVTTLYIDVSITATLQGMTGGVDGRIVHLVSVDSTLTCNIEHEHASATAANRFHLKGETGPYALSTWGSSLTVQYNGTASRWYEIARSAP